ncbi:50S ribosomal protein L15, chloroplastic-like [Hibiscus syriacus]|uniref:50S ribosomal protein L15, chloroplastic-like n=1 Tax=Hibiscus syriacus TaxID=106335 RepID=UPI00192371F8|nr:50S ribosomal protein L15, chloroplastic-like [Hibiscus syriacus]
MYLAHCLKLWPTLFCPGVHAGLPKCIPVNLKDIETAGFQVVDEVLLENLMERGLINPSGRERKLPLKILGDGELNVKLNLKARAFSTSAKEKLEAAGCSLTVLSGRKKWVSHRLQRTLLEPTNTLPRRGLHHHHHPNRLLSK